MRRLRLRAVWLLVVPFLWLARPRGELLVLGGVLVVVGLAIRAWSAGTIQKECELTVTGPYAFTRNPLYLGSFLLGLGITVAGGHWAWPVVFVLFYALVYGRTMAGEEELLTELFGDRYRDYVSHVPAVIPRLTPFRPEGGAGKGFTVAQYRRNREWEAALGALAGFAFLVGKWWWWSTG